ncbi:MAG: hypothetical protein AB1656_13735 [Candidatus Omnitrophota bacterium]
MNERIVSDTGPLISLEKMDRGFEFIRQLYETILVPPAVMVELAEHFPSPKAYLQHNKIENLIQVIPVQVMDALDSNRLHEGEAQAISLAINQNLSLLIEETYGRKIAYSLGLKVSGIARQIVVAFKKNLIDISDAERRLQELLDAHRINQRAYDMVREKINASK